MLTLQTPMNLATTTRVRRIMRQTLGTAAMAVASLALFAGEAAAQPSTLTIGDATSAIQGGPLAANPLDGSVALGQTFRPACLTTCFLENFSFWLDGTFATNPSTLSLQAHLAVWDGTKATNVLYSSNVFSGPAGPPQQYTFWTSLTAVNAATQYVAFLTVAGVTQVPASNATAYFQVVQGAPAAYTSGFFVFTNSGSSLADLTSTAWDYPGDPSNQDLQSRFQANFVSNVVPEPSSFLLVAAGAALLLTFGRRKRA